MKHKFTAIFLIAGFIGVCAFRGSMSPQDKLNGIYQERFASFRNALIKLKSGADSFGAPAYNKHLIRKRYDHVRITFKSFEYLLAYADPEFSKEYLNGPPLPRLEENSFGPNVIEPSGLQVLDGLVFGELGDSSAHQIQELCGLMLQHTELYRPSRISTAAWFASARTGLVRIYTMGLTGFDVPASGNAIPDAISGLQAIRSDLDLYGPEMQKCNAVLCDSVFTFFDRTLLMLENAGGGDRLNRFTLLRDQLDPLYAMLLRMHLQLGYELPEETTAIKQAVNYRSSSLFDPVFLNAGYFLDMPGAVSNPESIALGRLLFFDPILSDNLQRSCASCHMPEKAFSDGLPKSKASDNRGTLIRNAPGLLNCVYSDRYFHDLRSEDLGGQMEHVVTNPREFNSTWEAIIEKLQQSSEYRALFQKAFAGDSSGSLNAQNLRFAMAAYVGSLNSFNSQFDRLIRGEEPLNKTNASIVRGYNLFMGKAACGTCHFAPVFNGSVPPFYRESESEILGVPENPYSKNPELGNDRGRGGAMLKEQIDFNLYAFKTPGLRNIAETAPYMHNGAYRDLQKVMEFYNLGGGAGIGIHLPNQTLSPEPLKLKSSEINDIISFLNALSDNPFKASAPDKLPVFENHTDWNRRKPGGDY